MSLVFYRGKISVWQEGRQQEEVEQVVRDVRVGWAQNMPGKEFIDLRQGQWEALEGLM